MALKRLNTVMRIDQRRVAVYGATVRPASREARTPVRIRMAVEVGEQPAVEYIENVRDGRMELGPDALGHGQSGEALYRACVDEGIDFYRMMAGIARALEDMTQPFGLSRRWVEHELASRDLSIKAGLGQERWDVEWKNLDENAATEGFECLHDVAFTFGLAIPEPRTKHMRHE